MKPVSHADPSTSARALADELQAAITQAREDAREDPFGNPILYVTLWLTRRLDRGEISEAAIGALLQHLAREAVADRAKRLRSYVGLQEAPYRALQAVAERLATSAEKFEDFAATAQRTRYAAVFTAHPTFGMQRALARRIAAMATQESAAPLGEEDLPLRPDPNITLQDEFEQARDAVRHAHDAIDAFNKALFEAARERWPERWTGFAARPITLASWVGCDTDGRTDIGWWDTLRYRLESKRGQFSRILEKLPAVDAACEVKELVSNALAAVEEQLAKAPPLGGKPSLEELRDFSLLLVNERDRAICEAGPLIAALERAIKAAADDETRLQLCLINAGCVAHGASLALPHFRLNASQLHNAMRGFITVEGEPNEPALRRTFLAAANNALGTVEEVKVDFGALAAERASATRMVLTITQILKHVDGTHPVRFLIAETETGYTLLAALWLARRFGIADRIEISPLFETSDALEQGPRIIDEALRSSHWRDYLKQHGRLCIQFGYSDSGRYIGQLASTFWVERLRNRIRELMRSYDLADVELVMFDTHGESVGRGAHPDSLADRLAYLEPRRARQMFAEAGIRTVLETSFQGSDGYLLFGSAELAAATVARIAEHSFADLKGDEADPIYDEPDFATEFFQTVRQEMAALVDDPGYAALIGTFGPSLLDKTGSRPAARQSDSGGPARIRHPRELRAIPNNAILQQLGWLANSVHGIGHAAARAPDLFRAMRERSERFERSYRLAQYAMGASSLDVLRAYLDTLDPGSWVDRARRTRREGRREELLCVAGALSALDLAPDLRRLFGRFATDWLKLKSAMAETPEMSTRLAALHALRLAAIHRIWFLATHLPDFRPQGGGTREAMMERILRLDVPGALDILVGLFPIQADPTAGIDFGEPAGPREGSAYESLHHSVFEPMRRWFEVMREITGTIQHEIGFYG